MKILFINKYDTIGGAAVAAMRLSEGLRKFYSTENRFIVGVKRSASPEVQSTISNRGELVLRQGANYLMNRLGLQYQYIPFSSHRMVGMARQFNPDVISLHNVHGGYFEISSLRALSDIAPVVWTLHDMWAFTANAAHTFGDTSWKTMSPGKQERLSFPSIGLPTGRWLLQRKKEIYHESHFSVVAPSRWLFDLARQSPLFAEKRIEHIPNGIDLEVFRPLDKKSVRKKLNVPEDAKAVFFSSEDLRRGDFKGGSLLINILNAMHTKIADPIHLIIVGGGTIQELTGFNKFVLHQTGFISDAATMVDTINAADLLLYPSKADNLPNVLIESIACGVPAVTYDTGGCAEIIDDNVNGFVVPRFDADQFADRAIELLSSSRLREQFSGSAKAKALRQYDISNSAKQYYAHFQNIIEKRTVKRL